MHSHSTEAEVRSILEQAARLEGRIKLGSSMLSSIASEAGGLTHAEAEAIDKQRKHPVNPSCFSLNSS